MSTTGPNAVIRYQGTYRHGVDEQRRVQVPAKWRPASPDLEFSVMQWPKHQAGTCLRVMPPHEVERLMADIDKIDNEDPNKGILRWLICGDSELVTLDKAGRISLPDRMLEAAQIKKESVIVGVWNRFEIWNPDRHQNAKATNGVMAAAAFKLME